MATLNKDTTAAIVDGILRFVALGGFMTTLLIAPNAIQALDKPLSETLKKLDRRTREREIRRIAYYMKQKGLISYSTRDYEHGMKITKRGRDRLKKRAFSDIKIQKPEKWDEKWRLIFFDIPVQDNFKRQSLTLKLGTMGFRQLQRSIWVYPFPCRPEIEAITEILGVRKFVTYIEISEIDAENKLRKRFSSLLRNS